jgi:hypothetical protein
VNDEIAEGNHTAAISISVSSNDSSYNNYSIAAQSVLLTDNDSASVLFSQSGNATIVNDQGSTDTIQARLSSAPLADVIIAINAESPLSIEPSSLTFTPSNWNQNQSVSVSASNDERVHPERYKALNFAIESGDPVYDELDLSSIQITIQDSSIAGVELDEPSISALTEDDSTSATVSFSLQSRPEHPVQSIHPAGTRTMNLRSALAMIPSWRMTLTMRP